MAIEHKARLDPATPARDPGAGPAIILGPARSGTSLLYKALCLHPDASFISNWVAHYPRLPSLAALNRLARRMPSWQRRVWFADGANAYVYGQDRSLRERLFPMPVEGEPVYTRAGAARPGADDHRDVNPITELPAAFEAIRRYGGGSHLLTKRITNNIRVEMLAEALPAARFVSLVRDGRPVALSLSRVDWWADSHVWWSGYTPREWAADGGDPLALCARNWVEEVRAIRAGLAHVPPERSLSLRYEDLIADPIAVMEDVARFVGLGPSEAWRTSLASLTFRDRNGEWKNDLPEGTIERITDIQREELEAHGYPL